MGVFIPPGYGLASVLFATTGGAHPMRSTFGVNPAAVAPSAVPLAIANELITAGLTLAASMTSVYTFLGVEFIFETESGPVTYVHNANVVGTVSSAGPPPNNCALIVAKSTDRGGRAGRGRMYWPPAQLLETTIDGAGNIGGAQITDQQGKFDTFLGGLLAADVPMILLHSDPTMSPDGVQSLTVRGQLGTQRTRMR
jgi:hypothetical protein